MRSTLEEHQKQLTIAALIIKAAHAEPALKQDPGALKATEEIGTTAQAIEKHLKSMSGSGRFTEIASNLVKGKQKKEVLNRLMGQLSRRKDDLIAFIGIVNVDLSQRLTDQLQQLLAKPGGMTGLEGGSKTPDSRYRSRIITNNTARGKGFMLNGPAVRGDKELDKKDLWEDVDYLLIDGNQVEDSGFMINYATTLNNLKAIADDVLSKVQREVAVDMAGQA
ncbi:hypothetical protein F5Y05DRAFT_411805 [Hypoxylon sp. FL0543]|nr:hypothetical protein F5Y05DRAFT_411805 [Hypoxylon sp. FL0543]